MFGLSFWEIALVLVVALLVLGPQRLPRMLRTVGRGMSELRRASSGLRDAIEEPLDELRQPLEGMRDELVDAVHSAQRTVKDEAERDPPASCDRPKARNEDERTLVEVSGSGPEHQASLTSSNDGRPPEGASPPAGSDNAA